MNDNNPALEEHLRLQGKIETGIKEDLTHENLSLLYTPGVGEASKAISADKSLAKKLTISGNTVAVVSDGSAVLGLGNIGASASLPVMEGKAMLFKSLAGINAFPICLDTQDTEEIIKTVKNIAPNFAGINLEDISAPRCYEIEKRLQDELDIPVMHDDQHATAIVILAGLINASKVVGKNVKDMKITIIGAGPAGYATTNLLRKYGAHEVIVCDSKGPITQARDDLDAYKSDLAVSGKYSSALEASKDADVIIGLSRPGSITKEMIKSMSDKPIVFMLSNPTPEIMPEEAKSAGAYIIATGRNDFPNQLNNVLVFPGIFSGMISAKVNKVTDDIKIRTAEAIAGIVTSPSKDEIIPSVFDKEVAKIVSNSLAD